MADIQDLPYELIVDVFFHLDLKDLTRCLRVSKLLKAITECSAFDKIFFRTKTTLSEYFIGVDKLQINPALSHELHYFCDDPIEHARFLLSSYDSIEWRSLPLIESSAADQNATEPPVSRITLRPHIFWGREKDSNFDSKINNEQGITVLDIMEGLCEYYRTPGMPHDEYDGFFQGFYTNTNSTQEKIILSAGWDS